MDGIAPPSPSQRRRWPRRIGIALLALVALCLGGAWIALPIMMSNRVDQLAADLRNRGWEVTMPVGERRLALLAPGLTYQEIALAQPQTGARLTLGTTDLYWSWARPRSVAVDLSRLTASRDKEPVLEARFQPQPATLRAGLPQRDTTLVPLDLGFAEGVLRFQDQELGLREGAAFMRPVHLGTIAARRTPNAEPPPSEGPPGDSQIGFKATAPQLNGQPLAWGGLALAALDLRAGWYGQPPDHDSLATWLPQQLEEGRPIELHLEATLGPQAEPSRITLLATVERDPRGLVRLIGTVEASRWQPLLTAIMEATRAPPVAGLGAALMLKGLERPAPAVGGAPEVSVPIAIENGRLTIAGRELTRLEILWPSQP